MRLDKTNFDFSAVNKAGSPLGFNKPDGSPLPFEIERWDSGGGQAEIWVLVDTVFGSDSAQFITMNWDLAGAALRSNGAAVFDTANQQVYGVNALGEVTQNVYDANGNLIESIHYANRISPSYYIIPPNPNGGALSWANIAAELYGGTAAGAALSALSGLPALQAGIELRLQRLRARRRREPGKGWSCQRRRRSW